MVETKTLYTQLAIVLVLSAVAPSNTNAQTYTYGCTERIENLYNCTDGEHAYWERYNPYYWSADPEYIGEVLEIFGTPSSVFECEPVEPGTNSRRRVRGRIRLHHPIGLPSNPDTAWHSANVECWSPPPPPPPPPPIIVFNESPSSNLEFMLCLMGVRPGAPREIVGLQPGEEGDRCASDPDGGVDEIESPPNNF